MIFVWLIIALGIFIFLVQVGEGIDNYLSNKGVENDDKQDVS